MPEFATELQIISEGKSAVGNLPLSVRTVTKSIGF